MKNKNYITFNVLMPIMFIFILNSCISQIKDEQTLLFYEDQKELYELGYNDTNDAVLLIKRVAHYYKSEKRGLAYVGWQNNNTSSIYNFTTYNRIKSMEFRKLIKNNVANGDFAFSNITGFFEIAYLSDTDKKLDSYLIYIPENYSTEKDYPLIVFLHGYGDGAYIGEHNPKTETFLDYCNRKEVILIAPNGRHWLPEHMGGYRDDSEDDVLKVISHVKERYRIDQKRIYLTGISMGGYGTWYIGSRNSNLFAAIAPTCGYGTGKVFGVPQIDLSLLKDIPVYVTHGDEDASVPVSESRTMVKELQKINSQVIYRELEGVGHNSWDILYQEEEFIDWLLGYEK